MLIFSGTIDCHSGASSGGQLELSYPGIKRTMAIRGPQGVGYVSGGSRRDGIQ